MEFRDALKSFRSELGLAQADIAAALHINIATVGRWEQGKTAPSRSIAIALLAYAKRRSATSECVENLEKTLNSAAKQRLSCDKDYLFSVEHFTISQFIENASFPIYVSGLETDEILYVNNAAEQKLGKSRDELTGKKCYKCIMRKDTPCEFCHKNQLTADCFSGYEAFCHVDGNHYRVFGMLGEWNGHAAQMRYAFELGGSIQITSRNELRLKYEEQLSIRRQLASDAIASAHFNLTIGTTEQIECHSEAAAKRLVSGRYEDVIHALSENTFAPEEKSKLDAIRDKSEIIKLFFQGKTHISIKHRVKGLPQYYELAFDLLQNPITYNVEAFATLRDITEDTVSDQIINTMMRSSYESIMTIDAATGKAHPYQGKHINDVIKEQRNQGDNAAGVEAYLRLHCADSDVERVIRETSLPYVKEQLKTKPVFTVAYSLNDNGQIIHKQTQYSYLDEEQTTILCMMQNLSEAYQQFESAASSVDCG